MAGFTLIIYKMLVIIEQNIMGFSRNPCGVILIKFTQYASVHSYIMASQ